MKRIDIILIGAGERGRTYTDTMLDMPEKFNIVAVAEPIDNRREDIKKKHNLPDDRCFRHYDELLKLGKIADAAIVSTMDRDHFDPAMKAVKLGYNLLLEKPIAPTAKECVELTRAADEMGVKVVICTVLRYTPTFIAIKDIIDSGKIGKVMSINHEECVGNIHQSHSFIRGNWGNEERSSFMLLQKSCHDIDILQWLLNKKCKKVQSFGALSYFKPENAPQGAPNYCIEGCPAGEECPYNAVKLYYEDKEHLWFRRTCTKMVEPTDEAVKTAISTTQYGKCVYKCDNTVVDHQTVNMLFEDDITVTFTMNAFNEGGRHLHIMGTKGEIFSALDNKSPIEVFNLETRQTDVIPIIAKDGILGGHGGGDNGIVNALYDYLCGDYHGKSVPEIDESCQNHLYVFAAEKSRLEGRTIDVDEFIREVTK